MKHALESSLEKALNYFLSLDTESAKRIAKIQDKIAVVELTGLSLAINLHFIHGKIHIVADASDPDVIVRGAPLSLVGLTFSKKNRQQFFADDVKMEGDAELGQQVIQLFDELDIDWEEHLSQIIGDVSAHQVGKAARSVRNFAKKFTESLTQNVNEYVHEEKNFFPTREMMQDFFHEIDEVRMDADRLEARVKALGKE